MLCKCQETRLLACSSSVLAADIATPADPQWPTSPKMWRALSSCLFHFFYFLWLTVECRQQRQQRLHAHLEQCVECVAGVQGAKELCDEGFCFFKLSLYLRLLLLLLLLSLLLLSVLKLYRHLSAVVQCSYAVAASRPNLEIVHCYFVVVVFPLPPPLPKKRVS